MHELSGDSGSRRIVTLRQVWADYQITRKLKARTVDNYQRRLTAHLSDWLDLSVTDITKDMVEARHRKITETAPVSANSTMRTLRALFFYAANKYEDAHGRPLLRVNPVSRLTEVRGWNRERRRTNVIRPQQWRPFFKAVYSINNSSFRDLLLFLALTGLRRSEAINLAWQDVDLSSGVAIIRNTKMHNDFELPLNDFTWELLKFRSLGAQSPWVFPGKDPSKPVSPGTKSYMQVCKAAGFAVSLHDLRRSWITMGDELEMRTEVIKALVNHRSEDVTEGYTIRSTERLRRASQKICNAILHFAGIRCYKPL